MRMMLLDVNKEVVSEVEASSLDDCYKLLDCDCVEVYPIWLGGYRYNVIASDYVGESAKFSAINSFGEVMFIDSILIAGENGMEGDWTSLTDETIENLNEYLKPVSTHMYPQGYVMLTGVERN